MPDRPDQHPQRPAQHPPRPDRDRVEVAIDTASWAGTLAIFAYGAALSYQVLHTTALACGLSPPLARLWPLGFESFMAVAAVSVLAEQRAQPGRIPWYPWALTALAAGGSILLNFAHPYLPLQPPPKWLVAAVYGVPPVCAPFAWHLFLLRIAHRRHPQHSGQNRAGPSGAGQDGNQDEGEDTTVASVAGPPAARQSTGPVAVQSGTGQDGQAARAVVRALLAQDGQDGQDGPVSWQQVAERTGLSRSRAYALLREERARGSDPGGQQPAAEQPPG